MMTPMAPATDISAAAKGLLYPAFTISGIMMPPMAATVAGPEPEMAAKSMQVRMATMASPPVKLPRSELQKLISRREMPPPSMRLPATMNSGMASRGKESTEVNIRWATTSMGVEEAALMATKQEEASTTQMGKPARAVTRNVINR